MANIVSVIFGASEIILFGIVSKKISTPASSRIWNLEFWIWDLFPHDENRTERNANAKIKY